MNIAEIIKDIKDCTLYCTLFSEVTCNVNDTTIEVKAGRMCTTLDKEGRYSPQGVCHPDCIRKRKDEKVL